MENNLLRILNNQSLDENTDQLCDFTIEEQNQFSESQGIKPSVSTDYIPVLGKSVTYIVAVVIFNEKNELLLIQEAKKSCAGKWYLPAGRMENKENIVEAAEREVLEETGLYVKISTLLAVESACGSWFRFVLTGNVTGGKLKSPSEADTESLQAKWIDNLNEVTLRSQDVLNIIELGRNYHNRSSDSTWHNLILPGIKSHKKNYLRLVIAVRKRSSPNRVNILVSEKNERHFPTTEIHPGKSLHSTLRKFMVELFGSEVPQHRLVGLLSVEHDASVLHNDGICLTLLVVFKPTIEEVTFIGKCSWFELSQDVSDKLSLIVVSKHSTFPLHVIR
ncbi:CLUMA_CG011491, isoform A [Clunio marinus]|uniref:CLUMA_CG011491, isoform A n=1 Tax=Clunio marinus TaxID=568069 RepID=A0A1J1ID37_9DIPT|nr:CLUMA_CG011491, isoform A [Clunio marinus]